jgi:hypothetical protein
MDIFAHFLWSVAIFWNQRHRLYAGLLGILPDLLSFGLLFVAELGHITGNGPPPLHTLPTWLFVMYNITHSFVVWIVLFVAVWLIMRKFPLILLAWGIHIISDVFTHSPEYFPTPVVWPVSDWKYLYGVSWGAPTFMIINYSALAVVYLLILKHFIENRSAKPVVKIGKKR